MNTIYEFLELPMSVKLAIIFGAVVLWMVVSSAETDNEFFGRCMSEHIINDRWLAEDAQRQCDLELEGRDMRRTIDG